MILANPLAPLENLLRNLLDFFHNSVGLPWGWAIVDGVQIWILTAAVVAGLWLATRLSNGSHPLWFLLELIALLAGAFGARIAGSAIAPRVMRWLKA